MTLQDFGLLAEIVAAIAVVISLIYLALQVRHSAAQDAASASANILNEFNRMQEVMLANPLVPELYAKLENDDELTATEKILLEAIARRYLVHWMEIQIAYNRNLADEVIYISFCEDVRRIIKRYPKMHREFQIIFQDYTVGLKVPIFEPIFESNPDV